MFRNLLCVLTLLMVAPSSFAHPMGNFSVNHYSKIALERDGIKLTYIIDLAEIPTYQELQQGNVTADIADPAAKRYVESRGQEFAQGLTLMLDGRRLPLKLLSSQVIFPPGAGGLPTMKMGFVYQARYRTEGRTADPSTALLRSSGRDNKGEAGDKPQNSLVAETAGNLRYFDNNYPGHAGWKEIVTVANPGTMVISSSAPKTDRSAELTNYPTDLLNSPPPDLSATIQFHYPAALRLPRKRIALAQTAAVVAAAPPLRLQA